MLLDDETERYSSHDKKWKYDIHVYFYDVHDLKRMDIGMKNLKSMTEISNWQGYLENRKLRIMICGD